MTFQWGTLQLQLDHPEFQQGYQQGRECFFENVQEVESSLSVRRLLSVIAIPDKAGHYQLDDGWNRTDFPQGVEEVLGFLVGYLSGPLHPETDAEQQVREAEGRLLVHTE